MSIVAVPATADNLPVPASDQAPVVLPTGEPAPGPVPGRPRRGSTTIGTMLFVTADAMVLAAICAVYFAIKEGSAAWPPVGVQVGTYIPTMITLTVAMTAFSVHWGLFAARRNDGRNAGIALALTLFLGLAIANLEWLAFIRSGFGFNDHTYGTLYDVLIGYHLVHLLAAIVVLLVLAFRTLAGHFSQDRHDALRAGAVFWQYSNIVWFLVVSVLFLASRHG
ncbi:MAG TPA: cytochrome c oxidase subunit 3 [Acidimicrobiales bacterium]|nr:cytochrome c oxidase subunit 3 [Acidimicrobiales bacterium]